MKKFYIFLVVITIAISVTAQTPQSFKYQTVIRNNSGEILANQNVKFLIGILSESTNGPTIYSESHDKETNEFGLVNLEIGKGNVVTGVFESIDWGANSFFIRLEIDETGGTNFALLGTSQLLSVPYALHSGSTSDTSTWKKEADNIFYNKGNVGIGTNYPEQLLSANGIIESMTDGFKFPDGTVQTTAASSEPGGTSDSIVFGGPHTAAEQRGFIGMYIDGIPGSWEWGLDCENCSVVYDLEWSIHWTGTMINYMGSKVHNFLTVYKNIDQASVSLVQKTADLAIIPEVQFRFYRFNPAISNYEIYYTITLETAAIAGFQHDVHHTGYGNMAHMDKLSFIYETIHWEWLDGNITGQDSW